MKLGNRGRGLAAVLATACLCAGLTASAQAETVPVPPGGTSADWVIGSISCPSAGDCSAVGSYVDSSTYTQGLLLNQVNGSWNAGRADLSGLVASGTDPQATLDSVSCASAGNCTAVGGYIDSGGTDEAFAVTETGGAWGAAVALPTPAGDSLGNLDESGSPPAVSCWAAGDCAAVLTQADAGTGPEHAFIETELNGSWSVSEVTPPNSGASPYLGSVSCVGSGDCAAVGDYTDTAGDVQVLVSNRVNGAWSAPAQVTLPSNAGAQPNAYPESVSCASAGDCTQVGYYDDTTGSYQAFMDTETNGVWAPSVEGTLPADAATNTARQDDLYVNSVSCGSPGNCTAVGTYDATAANNVEAMTLTQTNGSWAPAVEVSLPSDAATSPKVSLSDIACPATGHCDSLGYYTNTSGDQSAMLLSGSGTTWTVSQPALASTEARSTSPLYGAAACSTGGYCAVGGGYLDSSNRYQPLLLTAPGAGTASASTASDSAVLSWGGPPLDNGGLAVTGYDVSATDLTDAARGGQTVSLGAGSISTSLTGLTGGDSYTFTVAATNQLGVGIPATSAAAFVPPSTTELWAKLNRLLAPTGAKARLKAIRRAGGYRFSFTALDTGRLTIDWYHGYTTGKGKHRKKHSVLVAAGSTRISKVGNAAVRVKLTARGRKLLKTSRSLRVASSVSFAVPGRKAIRKTRTFLLR